MSDALDMQWAVSRADPFGQVWPDSLITALNTDPGKVAAHSHRFKEEIRKRGGSVRGLLVPNATKVRKQQQELRSLVDRFLKEEDITTVVRTLREKLDQQPYRVVIVAPEEVPDLPVKKGAKAIMRYQRWEKSGEVRYDDWLGFARLLDDPLIERLRKCPECGKYFLATEKITKQYCSAVCGMRNRRIRQIVKDPAGYLSKEQKRVKNYRQRRKQQSA
jgi:hypothetical protein